MRSLLKTLAQRQAILDARTLANLAASSSPDRISGFGTITDLIAALARLAADMTTPRQLCDGRHDRPQLGCGSYSG
jgi:hypothetical protein